MTPRAYILFQLFLLVVWLGGDYLPSGLSTIAVAYMYLAFVEVIRTGDAAEIFGDPE